MNSPNLKISNRQITASSLQISKDFQKHHRHVLRDVENAIALPKFGQSSEAETKLIEDFAKQNFFAQEYKNKQGRHFRYYEMTEAGFYAITLAYTSDKAKIQRIRYINAFESLKNKYRQLELEKLRLEYVTNTYLPFGQDIVRSHIPVSDAVKTLHILGLYPDMTSNRLKGMAQRGEIEGFHTSRGWRIYRDQITKLATIRSFPSNPAKRFFKI